MTKVDKAQILEEEEEPIHQEDREQNHLPLEEDTGHHHQPLGLEEDKEPSHQIDPGLLEEDKELLILGLPALGKAQTQEDLEVGMVPSHQRLVKGKELHWAESAQHHR